LAWTTRFGITGEDGKLEKPENAIQPDGTKIPWGVGKLAASENAASPSSSSNATYSMTPAMSTAMDNNAAVVIAVSLGAGRMMASGVVVLVAAAAASFLLI
jgi:hypothetical protein